MNIKRWYTVVFPQSDGKMGVEKRKKKAHAYSLASKLPVDCIVCQWEQTDNTIKCIDLTEVKAK